MAQKTVEERFNEKYVVQPDGCWRWTAYIGTTGYAEMGVDYRKCKAHRVAYELFVGPIPDGLVLDHLCRNRWCVNPDHLEPVTHRENLLRGVGPTATNAVKTHCKRGHSLHDAYLNRGKRGVMRECRECKKIRGRQRYWRLKMAGWETPLAVKKLDSFLGVAETEAVEV